MKNTHQKAYLAPEVEVMEVSIEQGFANSVTPTYLESIGPEYSDINW